MDDPKGGKLNVGEKVIIGWEWTSSSQERIEKYHPRERKKRICAESAAHQLFIKAICRCDSPTPPPLLLSFFRS
jgi:hypothetical protein